MINRFIIALDNARPDQQDAVTRFLKEHDFEFWHWIEDLWLLSNVSIGVTPQTLWEELNAIPALTGQDMVILAFNSGISHWGQLPKSSWNWLAQNWGAAQ